MMPTSSDEEQSFGSQRVTQFRARKKEKRLAEDPVYALKKSLDPILRDEFPSPPRQDGATQEDKKTRKKVLNDRSKLRVKILKEIMRYVHNSHQIPSEPFSHSPLNSV